MNQVKNGMSFDQEIAQLLGVIRGIADISEQNTRDIAVLKETTRQLASIAGEHQQSLEMHQQRIEMHHQSIEEHRQSMAEHRQSMAEHQRRFDAAIAELQRQGSQIQEMQAEVRGLQTENRRILDQLINRNDDQG